jgi:diaminopimelate decarboxylase/aspartate kinase
MMNKKWIVLKFGGTSVSHLNRWETILKIAKERIEENFFPVIVCSAVTGISSSLELLGKESVSGNFQTRLGQIRHRHFQLGHELGLNDKLIEKEIGPILKEIENLCLGISLIGEMNPKLQARLMAQGEILSTKLGTAFFQKKGLNFNFHDVRQTLIISHDNSDLSNNANINLLKQNFGSVSWRDYLQAQCDFHFDELMENQLRKKYIKKGYFGIITQGFIAQNQMGETVLLGRGGSDTSAAYLAAKLKAHRCEIWTDVPGMYTANPREVPQARILKRLSYQEAQEVASLGAKVLHPRCLGPVSSAKIPLSIHCTERPDLAGTVVSESEDSEKNYKGVKSLSVRNGITLISIESVNMWQEVGFLARLFKIFENFDLSIDLLSTSQSNVTVSLDPSDNTLNIEILERLKLKLTVEKFGVVQIIENCSAIGLIGLKIRATLHKLTPVFKIFEEKKIYLMSQAASDLNLTFVVPSPDASNLLEQLHAPIFDEVLEGEDFGHRYDEVFGDPDKSEKNITKENNQNFKMWWNQPLIKKKLIQITDKHTPCYVYHGGTIKKQINELKKLEYSVEGKKKSKLINRFFYAMKANDHVDVLKTIIDSGCGIECVSIGELNWVKKNFPKLKGENILFTPNFASQEEFQFAFKMNAWVTLDSLYPMENWPKVFSQKKVILRVDPGKGRGHHDHVYTAGDQSKFGVTLDEIEKFMSLAKKNKTEVVGLHAHAGSGIHVPEHWKEVGLFLLNIAEKYSSIKILNLGGGLGIPYRLGERSLDLKEVGIGIKSLKDAYPQYELWMEPGRFIVAQAGILLAKVTQVKCKGTTNYVGLNTGMNSLIRPALYGSYHGIYKFLEGKKIKRSGGDKIVMTKNAKIHYHVVGPICETGDYLGLGRPLPECFENDILLIDCAGAYGKVMSSFYNRRSSAQEIFIK